MEQTFFIVWRECFVTLIVVSIIYSWIKHNPDSKSGMRHLFSGLILGVLFLAAIIGGVFRYIPDKNQKMLMMSILILITLLTFLVVFLMFEYILSMGSVQEQKKAQQMAHSWTAAMFIAALTIACAGNEIILLLSDQMKQLNNSNYTNLCLAVILGIAVSALTFYPFVVISRRMQLKKYLIITSIIMLVLIFPSYVKAGVYLSAHNEPLPDIMMWPAVKISHFIDNSFLSDSFPDLISAYNSPPVWFSIISFVSFLLLIAIQLFLRKILNDTE